MAKLLKIISIVCILLLPATTFAQKQKSVKKMQDEHFDKQAEQEKKAAIEREEGLKRHQKIQAKSTQKQMKKTKKKSERYQKNKREPFLKRLFTK